MLECFLLMSHGAGAHWIPLVAIPLVLAGALPRKYVSSWLRCRGCGNYRYMNTEALQSANQRPLELLGVTSVEVLCSEIAIGLLILEHVEHDDQDCVTHGHDGALLAFARS